MKKNSIKYLQKIQLIQLSSIPIKISTVSRNKFKYNLDSQFQNSQTPFNLEITKSLYEIELGLKGLFRNSLKKKKKKIAYLSRGRGDGRSELLISSGAFVLVVVSAAIKPGSVACKRESPFERVSSPVFRWIISRLEWRGLNVPRRNSFVRGYFHGRKKQKTSI